MQKSFDIDKVQQQKKTKQLKLRGPKTKAMQ